MNGLTTPSRFQQLQTQLATLIADTTPGERLPSEPKLARQLGVSRATLREAMRAFETQGLIHRRQGVGTFVVHPSHVIESGLEVLESIESLAERIGLEVRMGALKTRLRLAEENEHKVLGLKPGDQVLQVSRVIEAENRPVAYLTDILPEGMVSADELNQSFTGSVLDLLLRRGDPPLATSRTEISQVAVDQEAARALGIQRGDVVLCFKANLYTVGGQVVDFSYSYFLPGYFRFHVVRRVG